MKKSIQIDDDLIAKMLPRNANLNSILTNDSLLYLSSLIVKTQQKQQHQQQQQTIKVNRETNDTNFNNKKMLDKSNTNFDSSIFYYLICLFYNLINFNNKNHKYNKFSYLFILSSTFFLIQCLILNVNASEPLKLNKKRAILNDTKQCTSLAVNSNYIEYTILYKDNVETASECCEFCNTNLECTVWTLQLDIGRCLLKSNRGSRIIDPGFISGFSERYFATLSTPIPSTTLEPTTTTTIIIPTTTSPSLTTDIPPISKCEIFNGVNFGTSFLNQATNVTLSICCDFCADFNICKSYTYYAANRTCLLYDSLDLIFKSCTPEEKCQSGRIFVNNPTTLLPTLNPTTATDYIQAYGFYSMFDRFQLRISNLSEQSNYLFINNLPLTDSVQIEFLRNAIKNLENSIGGQIQFYLQNKIFRVLIDNMAYLPSTRSIVISFIVILDSTVQDIYEGNVYLSLFNSLITNQVGFNNVKFFNETNAVSDLLPNISYFSLRSFNLNDLDQLSFLRIAIVSSTTERSVSSSLDATSSATSGPFTTLSSQTSNQPTTNQATSIRVTFDASNFASQVTSITGASSTTFNTNSQTTIRAATSAQAFTSTSTRRVDTTIITTQRQTSSSSTFQTTNLSTSREQTTNFQSSTTTVSSQTSIRTSSSQTTIRPLQLTSVDTTAGLSRNTQPTSFQTTDFSTNNQPSSTVFFSTNFQTSTRVTSTVVQTTTLTNPITSFQTSVETSTGLYETSAKTSDSQNTSPTYITSSFNSLIDLSTKLSSIEKCWIEIDTMYLGPDLTEVDTANSLSECCAACAVEPQCQSWVFNYLNQSCVLKSSFRHGYYAVSGYTSGFSKQSYDSYIKVSNSLGIKNLNLSQIFVNNQTQNQDGYLIKDEVVEAIQDRLYNLWYKNLLSNIQSVELYELSINITESNEPGGSNLNNNENVLIITYLLKLDPRISQNSQIIIKLINTINSTLLMNSGFYSSLINNLTSNVSNKSSAVVLPSTQISLIQLYLDVTSASQMSSIPTTVSMASFQQTSGQSTPAKLTTLVSNELINDFQIYNYQSGSCYIETNINYVSSNPEDDFAIFYANTREKCCFDCNQLSICKSWSYEQINQTCILKKSYRSNPTLMRNFLSGFKPTGLYSLSIARGLEFKNINNPIYDVLNNSTQNPDSPEKDLYEFMINDLESQISKIIESNKNIDFILKTRVTDVLFTDGSIFVSYELNLDPRYNDNLPELQRLMNALYAQPNYDSNPLLGITLPFANVDDSTPFILVPPTTSQFQIVAANTSFIPIHTTTPIISTTISLDQFSKYLGCFNDVTSNRDLDYSGMYPTKDDPIGMTVPFCIELCRNSSQSYAGLQFGRECYCGQSYGKYGQTDPRDCFITCSGDKRSQCGGFQKNAVYSVGLFYSSSTQSSQTTGSFVTSRTSTRTSSSSTQSSSVQFSTDTASLGTNILSDFTSFNTRFTSMSYLTTKNEEETTIFSSTSNIFSSDSINTRLDQTSTQISDTSIDSSFTTPFSTKNFESTDTTNNIKFFSTNSFTTSLYNDEVTTKSNTLTSENPLNSSLSSSTQNLISTSDYYDNVLSNASSSYIVNSLEPFTTLPTINETTIDITELHETSSSYIPFNNSYYSTTSVNLPETSFDSLAYSTNPPYASDTSPNINIITNLLTSFSNYNNNPTTSTYIPSNYTTDLSLDLSSITTIPITTKIYNSVETTIENEIAITIDQYKSADNSSKIHLIMTTAPLIPTSTTNIITTAIITTTTTSTTLTTTTTSSTITTTSTFTTTISTSSSSSSTTTSTTTSTTSQSTTDSIELSTQKSSLLQNKQTDQTTNIYFQTKLESTNTPEAVTSTSLKSTSERVISFSTEKIQEKISTNPVTGATLLVSTSAGIISPRPIVTSPNAFLITRIKVNVTVNVTGDPFKTEITEGLRKAYIAAFTRANSIFLNKAARAAQTIYPNDVQVGLTNITQTGQTNPEKTKNIVDLRYYVLSDNQLVPPEYAADSINLLSGQEMAQYLNQEVENQGYVEVKPRQAVTVDQKLWIIGAVLGPLALILGLFWLILFIYYKCISPRKDDESVSKSKSKILTNESPSSSQENIKQPKRSTKIKPAKSSEHNDDDDISIGRPKKTSNKEIETDKNDLLKKNNETQTQMQSSIIKLPDLSNISRVEVVRSEPNMHTSSESSYLDDDITQSIRQKTDLEKWRNKQRHREKNFEHDRPIEIENERQSKTEFKSQIEESNDFQEPFFEKRPVAKDYETKNQVSILTNNNEILTNQPKKPDNHVIVSEYSKISHVPVKVHVANKPTVEDTTRVYNPYPLQNEYERYAKNGFFLEPLTRYFDNQTKSSHSLDDNSRNSNNIRRNITSSSQVAPTNHANVTFTSEIISPYTRKDHSILFKKPVNNDKLLDYARSSGGGGGSSSGKNAAGGPHVNPSFKSDSIETEFQNFNHLKKKNDPNSNQASNLVADKDEEKLYEDEFDIINRLRKKTGSNQNVELINSINQELKRLKTGYKPDSSNA